MLLLFTWSMHLFAGDAGVRSAIVDVKYNITSFFHQKNKNVFELHSFESYSLLRKRPPQVFLKVQRWCCVLSSTENSTGICYINHELSFLPFSNVRTADSDPKSKKNFDQCLRLLRYFF